MAVRAYIGGRDPVAPGVGDRPLSPVGGGDRPPCIFFAQGPRCEFEKKITLRACRPMGGDRGVFFEIFQNGYIFLKFLVF